MADADVNAVVSHEQGGRILSGVGVTQEALTETMDRHTPADPPAAVAAPAPISTPASEPKKPETRGQRRFSELANERDAAKLEAARAAEERDALKARIEAFERQQPPPPAGGNGQVQAGGAPPPQQPQLTRPEPSEDEIGTKYPTYSAFTKDQAKWVLEQERATLSTDVRSVIEADRASRSFNDTVVATQAKGREVYADFDTVLRQGPGALVPMAPDRLQAIILNPASAHLQYVIAKDGALAQRLATCHPIDFGLELARLTPNGSGVSQASPAVSGSVTAPAPYQPVGSGAKTTVTPSADLPKRGFDFDKSGYREKRAAERGVNRRR
jgi:hypothetical protein